MKPSQTFCTMMKSRAVSACVPRISASTSACQPGRGAGEREQIVRYILMVGTPTLWFAFAPALVWLAWRLVARRDPAALVVSAAYVDEGPTLKRIRPRAQGRAYRINKRTSHITVIVASPDSEEVR